MPGLEERFKRLLEAERAAVLDEVDRRYGAAADRADVVNVVLPWGQVGMPLQAGDVCILRLGLNASVTIVGWSLGFTTVGTILADVLVGDSLDTLASICGTHLPAMYGSNEVPDYLLPRGTDWTTRLTDGQWIVGSVQSTSGLEHGSLTLRCRKSGGVTGTGAGVSPLGAIYDASGDVIVDEAGEIVVAGG